MIICSSDKFRFWLSFDDGTNYNELKLIKRPVLKYSREKDCYSYRIKSSEWKFKYSENKTIYSTLLTTLSTVSNITQKLKVKICIYETYAAVTETPYVGYVPLAGLKINEDNGVVQFSPEENDVNYNWWDQHKADKHDVINEVANVSTITYDVTTILEEYYVPFGGNYTYPTAFNGTPYSIPTWNNSTNYVESWTLLSWARYGAKLYHCTQANGPGSAIIEPGVSANWTDYWEVMDNGIGGLINVVYRTFRQTSDMPFTHGVHVYIQGEETYETGFPAVTILNSGASNAEKDIFYFLTGSVIPETGPMTLVIDGNLKLYDTAGPNYNGTNSVLDHLLFGSGLIVHSHFFEDALNPITGLTNKLTNLRLVHNAFVKAIDDYSTVGEITLNDFIKDLCEVFNLGWYISGNQFRIEHLKYFENGFQYVGSPTVGIDLTNQTTYPLKWQAIFDRDGGTTDKSYDYFSGSIPEKEIYKFMDGYDYNGQIKYISAYAKKGETKDHTISSFMTDFSFLLFFPADTISEMYSLIACDGTGKILKRNTRLRWIQGNAYSEAPYLKYRSNFNNGDLQWDNVLVDFHTYNRYFTKGNINGRYTATTFNSQAEIKKQAPIIFPRLAAFNPLNLIKTNLGDGRIDTAELDTDTDFIKVTLLY
jgi:hypothetical protein